MTRFARTTIATRLALGGVLAIAATAVFAEAPTATVSRPVVQPLPGESTAVLNSALRRLSTNPDDADALLRAGHASLSLGNIDAAIGFFTRADQAGATRGQAKAGLAAVQIRKKRPVEALELFSQAEREGASLANYAGERGLAYDLVGDNARAQQLYRAALEKGENEEITRRLALSLAIGGDRMSAEQVLLPLLQKRDLAAYRTRAFALASLGRTEEAVAIAEAMMPASLAERIAPYLRYMPRLTRAQQAAAGNFGHFPESSAIGHDDPRIAAYSRAAGTKVAVASEPGERLVPSGKPLGKAKQEAARASPARPAVSPAAPTAKVPAPRIEIARADPLPPASPSAAQAAPATTPGYFDLGAVPGASVAVPAATVAKAVVQPTLSRPVSQPASPPAPAEPPPEPVDLAAAFADFGLPQAAPRPTPGAVDITRIKPVREVEAKLEPPKPAKAAPPPNPSRFWVQVATGRDRSALAFDWRRISRDDEKLFKGKSGYVAKWGQTNRLLTGPFSSQKEANAFLASLQKAGIDSFTFTSEEGEQVDPLGGQ